MSQNFEMTASPMQENINPVPPQLIVSHQVPPQHFETKTAIVGTMGQAGTKKQIKELAQYQKQKANKNLMQNSTR